MCSPILFLCDLNLSCNFVWFLFGKLHCSAKPIAFCVSSGFSEILSKSELKSDRCSQHVKIPQNRNREEKLCNSWMIPSSNYLAVSCWCNSSVRPCLSCRLPGRNVSATACSRVEQSCSRTSTTEGARCLCYKPIFSVGGILETQWDAAQNEFSQAEDLNLPLSWLFSSIHTIFFKVVCLDYNFGLLIY